MPTRKMVMNKQYKGLENISAEDQKQVQDCFARWQQNRHQPNKEDVKTLFAKYHEYIYKSPSDMACPSCVQFVFDYWKGVIVQWERSPKPIN
jgi:hypothetical protein